MRVLLVGPSVARARMRTGLAATDIEVAGEFLTLTDARMADVSADAVMLVPVADGMSAGGDDRAVDRLPLLDNRVSTSEHQEELTRREVDVLELLAEGLPNRRIADRLGISDQTVKFHVASIFGKLGATNRTDAVRRAARRGLISL